MIGDPYKLKIGDKIYRITDNGADLSYTMASCVVTEYIYCGKGFFKDTFGTIDELPPGLLEMCYVDLDRAYVDFYKKFQFKINETKRKLMVKVKKVEDNQKALADQFDYLKELYPEEFV